MNSSIVLLEWLLFAFVLFTSKFQCLRSEPSRSDETDADYQLRVIKLAEQFVAENPEFEHLLHKIKAGDAEARQTFEKQSLSTRLGKLKTQLNSTGPIDEALVMKFLDDYLVHVKEADDYEQAKDPSSSSTPPMRIEEFLQVFAMDETTKALLIELGQSVARAECDYACLSDKLTQVMVSTLGQLLQQRMDVTSTHNNASVDFEFPDYDYDFIEPDEEHENGEDYTEPTKSITENDDDGLQSTTIAGPVVNDANSAGEL